MSNDFVDVCMKIRNQAVTGSQIKVEVRNGKQHNFLIDNGAFQENEGNEFGHHEDYSDIDAVFLTHAHIDHSGGLAEMARQCKIPVYGTQSTLQLIIPMLYDMYNVMGMRGRKGLSNEGIKKLGGMLQEVQLYSKLTCGNSEVTYIDNGHILGAAMVYLKALDRYRNLNILFSGDYREEHPFIRTHGISKFLKKNPVDVLVLESTYGNKEAHIPFSDSLSMLEEILEEGLEKGDVLLGSFSIDRTPVLLYMINQVQRANPKLAEFPVYLDGGLAIEGLDIYKQYDSKFKCAWSDIIPKNFDIVHGKLGRESIQHNPKHKIIISTSGQFHGGSIVSWVSKMLGDPNATIVQSGYVAHPIGKKIFASAKGDTIEYYGQQIKVRADLKVLAGASAHADKYGLAKLVERCYKENPKLKVILTHGDSEAKIALKSFLGSKVMPLENIYIQGADQHIHINKHTLASGKLLEND